MGVRGIAACPGSPHQDFNCDLYGTKPGLLHLPPPRGQWDADPHPQPFPASRNPPCSRHWINPIIVPPASCIIQHMARARPALSNAGPPSGTSVGGQGPFPTQLYKEAMGCEQDGDSPWDTPWNTFSCSSHSLNPMTGCGSSLWAFPLQWLPISRSNSQENSSKTECGDVVLG